MAGIFKANNPFNTFLLFVYGILLKLPWFLNSKDPAIGKFDGFLYKYLLPHIISIKHTSSFTYFLIVYLFIFTQAVIFNRLVVNQRLLQKANYLPGMCYLLLTSLFAQWNEFSSVLIVNTLLIWAFSKMNKLYNSQDPKVLLYNIGAIVGLCSFFYLPVIAYALLILFALTITRPVKLREWVVALIGVVTPYYFLFFYVYLTTGNLKDYRFQILKPVIPVFHITTIYWCLIGLVFLLAVTGCYFVVVNLRKQIVQVRKCWGILLFFFIISAIVSLLYSGSSLQYSLLVLVPLSACLASFFFYPRSRIILILGHWLLVAFIVYTGFFLK